MRKVSPYSLYNAIRKKLDSKRLKLIVLFLTLH